MIDSNALYWAVQVMHLYVGILWILGGLAVAATIDWDRIGRISVFTVGLMMGIYWLESCGYNFETGFRPEAFRYTSQAVITYFFLALAMTSLVAGLLVGLKRKGIGR